MGDLLELLGLTVAVGAASFALTPYIEKTLNKVAEFIYKPIDFYFKKKYPGAFDLVESELPKADEVDTRAAVRQVLSGDVVPYLVTDCRPSSDFGPFGDRDDPKVQKIEEDMRKRLARY